MCGIIGYIGKQKAVPVLIEGLRRLEYRGYDSAGVAFVQNGSLQIQRAVGKLDRLEEALASRGEMPPGTLGIGHTRWATHGRPSERNAHPHRAGGLAIVHNGIVENYHDLKSELQARGHTFASETDTEVIAHLIDRSLRSGKGLEDGMRSALKKVRGSYALCVVSEKEPDMLLVARNGCPLVIGLGRGEFFAASDILAVLPYTRDVITLQDGDMAVLTRRGVRVKDLTGAVLTREVRTVDWSPVMIEKAGYRHFMLKEIHEQPRVLLDTLRDRISLKEGRVRLDELGMDRTLVKKIARVSIIACGTSYHAALVGKYLIEEVAHIPVEAEIGSECRYKESLLGPSDLVIAISQSGETADTLAAVKVARARGARVAAICNVRGSSLTNEASHVFYTHAGPEIGVASTKTFTAQLMALYLIALFLGRHRSVLSPKEERSSLEEAITIPGLVDKVLQNEEAFVALAKKYFKCRNFLYLGRWINYPIALEGALKLKEISYIHAEGYPAGEMKHGPIALIDENMPVVVLIPQDKVYSKVLNTIMEVKARDGRVIALCTEGDQSIASKVDEVLFIPRTSPLLTPILLAVPLQLLAYHSAVLRGHDVDQPRNLAKSVTVE